jgi:hypothetical protein
VAIAGDTHAIPSRPIHYRDGKVYSTRFTTNKPRELVEQDIDRAARRLLAGERGFQMHCSGDQFTRVRLRINEILAEQPTE